MKKDLQIQQDILDELKWDPSQDAGGIAVMVKDGLVTLSGMVDAYPKKISSEKAAKRVVDVKDIVNTIQVILAPKSHRFDPEILVSVVNALRSDIILSDKRIKVEVRDGIVTLEGEVEWNYQRVKVSEVIEGLAGIRDVINSISLARRIQAVDILEKINMAFIRSATLDAEKINVAIIDDAIILTGKVRSFSEKEEAEATAWASPGVTRIENRLEVEAGEYVLEE